VVLLRVAEIESIPAPELVRDREPIAWCGVRAQAHVVEQSRALGGEQVLDVTGRGDTALGVRRLASGLKRVDARADAHVETGLCPPRADAGKQASEQSEADADHRENPCAECRTKS
jgi:hypothetical protein